MQSRNRRPLGDDERARMNARIEDLELRMKQLEARLRRSVSDLKDALAVQGKRGKTTSDKAGSRSRRRCPGCTLELPVGSRGSSCVWCGFQLDAVLKASR